MTALTERADPVTQPQHTLDLYPDTAGVLNARPGPETARGPHAPISPPGSSVEGATDDGRKGELRPRRALTDNQARGSVRSTDAPEARSREEVMNESDESTKVGVEVETPKPQAPPPETQTTEVEVETPEGQPDVEVEVERVWACRAIHSRRACPSRPPRDDSVSSSCAATLDGRRGKRRGRSRSGLPRPALSPPMQADDAMTAVEFIPDDVDAALSWLATRMRNERMAEIEQEAHELILERRIAEYGDQTVRVQHLRSVS